MQFGTAAMGIAKIRSDSSKLRLYVDKTTTLDHLQMKWKTDERQMENEKTSKNWILWATISQMSCRIRSHVWQDARNM